ncbi:MAG: type VI secretion system contractile sheath large subunit [Thiobacillaceae bacterium]|jgi:type VI secretion system protein ImpC|nr:type VI secretion system contractile sheath large subunit [Thiobacillaceae bacterium]
MTNGRLDFELRFSTADTPTARPSRQQAMRVLVLADLTGRGPDGGRHPLAERKVHMIDVDNAARVFARLTPRLSLALELPEDGGESVGLAFEGIDDFHPDRLYRHAALFERLRQQQQREALASSAGPNQAASADRMPGPAQAAQEGPPAESDAETLERLLGRAPEPARSDLPGAVQRLLREAIGPHVVRDTAGVGAHALAAHDPRVARWMRALLHHPDFQRLEATWRGVWKLATELESGEGLQIGLLDIRRDELDADLRSHADDLGGSALYKVLRGAGDVASEDAAWSLLVCDETFGPDEEDLTTLAGLGALARQAGAPVLAAASPKLLGCATAQELRAVRSLPETVDPGWRALRESPLAEWIGLALPRVLLRLPYGTRTDPIEAFPFEEFDGEPRHQHYLWGNPACALAFLAGRGFAERGWETRLDDCLELDDLPSHVLRDDQGESHQQPCAETLLSETLAEAVLEQGIMPLRSYPSRNAARLMRWQSIAVPPRRLAGPWR